MKIAIAMSGGVDSSVAAKILKDEGHEVVGLFLKLWSDPMCSIKGENKCCDYEALDDARAVAAKLDIPFYVINARDEFKKEVVDYFLREYKALRTPNPCIVCNDKIKFGLLLHRAMEIGCEKLATGHYARVEDAEISNSEKLKARSRKLKAGIDSSKDQSYMLYHLNQHQLSRVIFPLGEMRKKEVRALAAKWDLPVKEKPESQEICFFADKDYRAFLRRYLAEKYFKPGQIVDNKGNVLGEHQGLINYTIGQRKGVTQELKNERTEEQKDREPLYVVGFDVKKNQLIVGEDKDVYSKSMIVTNVNWIDRLKNERTEELKNIKVKIRYRHEAIPCKLKIKNKQSFLRSECPSDIIISCNEKLKIIEVLFNEPQRAVTPGQSAVFYLPSEASAKDGGDEVWGGGIIY